MRAPREVEEKLRSLLPHAARPPRRPEVRDVFARHAYIPPAAVELEPGLRPYAVFNPAAILEGRRLTIIPRVVVGYYWYVSVIAVLEPLDIEELLSREGAVLEGTLRARTLIEPSEWFESGRGAEDPRVHRLDGGRALVLYTGVAATDPDEQRRVSYQAAALVDTRGWRCLSRDVLSAVVGGARYPLPGWKNGAAIAVEGGRVRMLVRPMVGGVGALWYAEASLSPFNVELETLRPVMAPAEWEWRLGWSTNPVRLESGAYLVAWHGVSRHDQGYRHGFAVVDGEGRLLAVTPYYLLAPRTLYERAGDRPLVVYGCALLRYSDLVVWVGGAADTYVGVYSAELSSVMEHMVWLERG